MTPCSLAVMKAPPAFFLGVFDHFLAGAVSWMCIEAWQTANMMAGRQDLGLCCYRI
jgi:hypothetical protein